MNEELELPSFVPPEIPSEEAPPFELPGGEPAGFPWVGAGPIGLRFDAAPVALKDAISWFFPPDAWEAAASISFCESGYRQDAIRDTRGQPLPPGVSEEYSVGPWQINLLAHPQVEVAMAMDYWASTEFAASLWAGQGWRPWFFCAQGLGLL